MRECVRGKASLCVIQCYIMCVCCSSSGASVVAIDNKIEQAMVSYVILDAFILKSCAA